MFDSVVLGVDPGLSRCGVAVLRGPSHRAQLLASDVVRTPSDMVLGERLTAIRAGIGALARTHRPAALGVERVFINRQARTGVGAIQVMGLVHLLGAELGIPVVEYTPSQVKASVTGVGDADKDQVTFMVQRILRLADPPKPADRADAMAVALCHLQQPTHMTTAADRRAIAPGTTARDVPAGLPPRLAAAMAAAGPGLAAVSPSTKEPR